MGHGGLIDATFGGGALFVNATVVPTGPEPAGIEASDLVVVDLGDLAVLLAAVHPTGGDGPEPAAFGVTEARIQSYATGVLTGGLLVLRNTASCEETDGGKDDTSESNFSHGIMLYPHLPKVNYTKKVGSFYTPHLLGFSRADP